MNDLQNKVCPSSTGCKSIPGQDEDGSQNWSMITWLQRVISKMYG